MSRIDKEKKDLWVYMAENRLPGTGFSSSADHLYTILLALIKTKHNKMLPKMYGKLSLHGELILIPGIVMIRGFDTQYQ